MPSCTFMCILILWLYICSCVIGYILTNIYIVFFFLSFFFFVALSHIAGYFFISDPGFFYLVFKGCKITLN